MGKNIDKTMIQLKMLNTSKGPAVHSLRAQADRKRYQAEMKHTLEKQENLFIQQAEIVDIKVENGQVTAVETNIGAIYNVKAVVIASANDAAVVLAEAVSGTEELFVKKMNDDFKSDFLENPIALDKLDFL